MGASPLAFFLGGLVLILLAWIWRQERLRGSLQDRLLMLEIQQRTLEEQTTATLSLRDGLLKATPLGILVVDAQKRILFANHSSEALFGKGLSGKTLMAALRDPSLDDLVNETNDQAQDDIFEYRQQSFKAIVTPLGPDSGNLKIICLQDETEIRRLMRARRDMVANVSHELRTPITTIGLLAETLVADGLTDKKRARKMLKDINVQVATLTQLVQEMRDLSKIESGQMPIKLETCHLADTIQASLEGLMSLAEDKQQTIHVNQDPGLQVLADPLQIQRVLKNIVHNAIKFTPLGGRIEVHAHQKDGEVLVIVKDNGIGIESENIPRIFERFFQEDFARTDGTGLGLAIARHIVLAHGERIWLESLKNEGTSIFFTLSLSEDPLY
jgi:two-component system phosphate regulon sensor histidine kinase PhoR